MVETKIRKSGPVMIPANPSATTRRRYVRNIIDAYNDATEDQKLRGKSWYPDAHALAISLSPDDVRKGAGVIAALSANKSWAENQRLALRAFVTGKPYGHTAANLIKAERIMDGADPADILPMDAKTGNFYRCILNPSDPEPVCVDRHAHDVAVGRTFGQTDRGLSASGRYAAVADAYRVAARRLGIVPSTLQAIVWVRHVESLRGTGTRGLNH
jgi:hypothetical protein